MASTLANDALHTITREQALEQALISLAYHLASCQGDLTAPINLGSDDPIILRAEEEVREFLDRVRAALLQVSELTVETAVAAAGNGHQMNKIAVHVNESHDQLEQAATGVEQSQTGVSEVARSASSAAELAGQAHEATARGAAVIEGAIGSITRIQGEITIATDKTHALADRVRQVGQVSGVIDSIAKRTNLLALNAAIEAARAGQHGRGFGVVADEIRRLAESTAHQTREIRNLIEAIDIDLKAAETAIHSSKAEADQGVALAAEAGGALTQIQELVSRSTEPLEAIAGLAEEQSASLEQVSAGLQEMARQIGAVSEQARGVASVTANLAGMTEAGFSELTRFRVGSFVDEVAARARTVADEASAMLSSVVERGAVSLEQLLDLTYFEYKGAQIDKLRGLWGDVSRAPRDGFTPPKYGNCYDSLIDVPMRDLLDRHLAADSRIRFMVISDLNGYSPAQNSVYCRPWTGDPEKDFQSRVKRMNCDAAQVRASRMGLNWQEREPLTTGEADVRNMRTVHGRSAFLRAGCDLREPEGGDRSVLVQTFARHTGTIVNILSVPLYVQGQRYGAMILGWLPEGKWRGQ